MTTNKIKEEIELKEDYKRFSEAWEKARNITDEDGDKFLDWDSSNIGHWLFSDGFQKGYQKATADFIKMINNEIAETPNDNDCCRGFLINLKQMLVEKNAKT